MRVSNWKPQRFDGEIMTASMDRLERCAEVIATDARRRVRVRSGDLQKTIRVVRLRGDPKRNVRVYAGSRKSFQARWGEYGTSKMKAWPFLRPALNASKSKIQDILRSA